MQTLWLDIETRSRCDLKTQGLMRYATDPSTSLICMSYALNDEPPKTWFPEDGPLPSGLAYLLAQSTITLYAHNASFERLLFDFVICNDYNIPRIALTRWRCSSARAMAHGLPASLADLCKSLDLPTQKMTEGTRLISTYCAPAHTTVWANGDKALMQSYCETDVITMRQACSVLRELTDTEWRQYHITEQINDRGVPVDIVFARSALEYAEDIRADVDAQLAILTSGLVKKASSRKTRDQWLTENLDKTQLEILLTKDGKISFDKHARSALAEYAQDDPTVMQFLDLYEQAGGATISKYSVMINTHIDSRVHGALTWSGAGATGRYSSKGLQFQNMRRDAFDNPESLIEDVIEGFEIDRPADTLGRLIRAAITSPKGLTFSDFAQIEARVLPWLADEVSAEEILDVFRQGRDLYTENAKAMFPSLVAEGVPKQLRQAAKVAVLACGFGGGLRALQAMGKVYGMRLNDDEAKDIVDRWRDANSWAKRLWFGLEAAAHKAMNKPKTVQPYKRCSFFYDGADWLWLMLPSGRCLAYFQPRLQYVDTPWGEQKWAITVLWGSGRPKAGQVWPRRTLSHLILSENATQATAADIMRETVVRAYDSGLDVLFSVHDELVVEGDCVDQLQEIMLTAPEWAQGLPLGAETQFATRYGK